MISAALRRPLSALLALATAVVVPVIASGGTGASAQPRPVSTTTQSYSFTARPAPTGLAAPGDPAAAPGGEARSSTVDLGGRAHVVGVTWERGGVARAATVQIRERRDGAWGEWQDLESAADEGPDPDSPDAAGARGGTAPWVSTADAVQTRVLGDTRGRGRAARFDVVDATTTAADRDLAATPAGGASAAATRPTVYTRGDWGADESIRHAKVYEGVVRTAIVHHTAGSNDYTAAEVPSILRGIYVFHTVDRGWGDIGYNFLVDRFGRTWEGRYGGTTKDMVGAHAAPYNSQSTGISVIGDFTSATPPSAVPTAVSKLVAWRLGLERIDPTASTTLDGFGSAPTVIGHRDVNQTTCPGTNLYSQLASIRQRARDYQGTMVYRPSISRTSYAYGTGGVSVSGRVSEPLTWTLTVQSVCHDRPDRVVRGSASGSLSAAWEGRLSDGTFAPPGSYRVTLAASTGSAAADTAIGRSWLVTVGSVAGAPPRFCPPRLSGANRYAVAVATAKARSSSATKVVIVNGTTSGMSDALVAAPYARRTGAVLLLTRAAGLPDETRAEIRRRGVTSAVVVGGETAVGRTVLDQLRADGVAQVARIGGANRYEVSAAVARKVAVGGSAPDVLVASGSPRSMADGLVVSGPAARLGRPVVLVRPDAVPQPSATVLADLGTVRTVVAGGPSAVADDVLAGLPGATRIGGANRYAVSAGVAAWAQRSGVDVSSVLVSSGEERSLVDTLSGGQLGRAGVYVRSDALPRSVREWLTAAPVTTATVLGGSASVDLTTGGDVQRAVHR
ncbi:cell wall-binding repeat-containing protein [Phycicoccus flavus]|uniref:N-acetylmuramoyl-L-alanine amidase n=1 Tax=Phycicoccus flavus TaxID=2502783 RepID=A0A8T6R205_9MICO|nr:cell wall-binding repeat-containing protein [Phycicoccus flavus]NHA68007.1 hypothetical protein [Phycicoccus flavus]